MAAYTFGTHRIRLQVDVREVGSAIDRKSLRPIRIPRASRCQIEVGCFANLGGAVPSSADQVVDPAAASNVWTSLILAVQRGPASENLISKTITSFSALTFATWLDDTAQHGSFVLSAADTNITNKGPLYLSLTAIASGVSSERYVVGTGDCEIYTPFNLNVAAAAVASPGAVDYYSPYITGYTGGGSTKLDGYVTVGVDVGKIIRFIHATEGYRVAQLFAGTTSGGVGIIIPVDYNASTNAKYWKLEN